MGLGSAVDADRAGQIAGVIGFVVIGVRGLCRILDTQRGDHGSAWPDWIGLELGFPAQIGAGGCEVDRHAGRGLHPIAPAVVAQVERYIAAVGLEVGSEGGLLDGFADGINGCRLGCAAGKVQCVWDGNIHRGRPLCISGPVGFLHIDLAVVLLPGREKTAIQGRQLWIVAG